MKQKYFLAFMLPITIYMTGCGTPLEIRAVQKYTEFQTDSASLFPKIAGDIYQTCIRSLDYVVLNSQSIVADRDNRETICDDSDKGSIALKEAYTNTHNVIHDYLDLLGDLAANDLTNFDAEVNAVGESIKRFPGLGDGETGEAISAGTGLARILFTAFTNGYRRGELKDAIVEADPHLTTLVVALDTSIKKHYVNGLLETERNSVDRYYKILINPVLNQPESQNVAVRQYITDKLKTEWSEKQEIIREKQVLASDYLKLLKGIACDHSSLKSLFLKNKKGTRESITCDQKPELEKLFASSENPSPEEFVQILENYSLEVSMLNKKANELFSKN